MGMRPHGRGAKSPQPRDRVWGFAPRVVSRRLSRRDAHGLSRNFAPTTTVNGNSPAERGHKIFDFMKTSKISASASVASTTENKSAVNNAVVEGKSATTSESAKGETRKRVSETRSDWAVIENHTISLIVLLAEGKQLPEKSEARKGYAFKSANGNGSAPHARLYARGLLAAFSSKKAGKVFAASKNEVLADDAKRESIAIAIACRVGFASDAPSAKKLLVKDEKKRPKWLAEQVVAALAKAKPAEAKTSMPKSTTKGGSGKGKSAKKSTTKGGSKSQKGTRKQVAA